MQRDKQTGPPICKQPIFDVTSWHFFFLSHGMPKSSAVSLYFYASLFDANRCKHFLIFEVLAWESQDLGPLKLALLHPLGWLRRFWFSGQLCNWNNNRRGSLDVEGKGKRLQVQEFWSLIIWNELSVYCELLLGGTCWRGLCVVLQAYFTY